MGNQTHLPHFSLVELSILELAAVCKTANVGPIPTSISILLSRGEVGEHNGLIHRHLAGSSPAATTISVLSEFAYIVVF